ncbi:hypothetical protein KAR10_00545 [bacterium]|nr:hypothetical protein [bacterium]
MKHFVISACCLLYLTSGARAQTLTRNDTLIYYVPLCYQESLSRETGLVTGIYHYFGYGSNASWEAAVDFMQLKYTDGFMQKQADFTAVYTNYACKNIKFYLGTHYITTQLAYSNQGLVFLGGINYYRPHSWNAALEGMYSVYSGYEPSLRIAEVSPKLGFYLWTNILSSGYIQVQGYYIQPQDYNIPTQGHYSEPGQAPPENKKYCLSAELSLTLEYQGFMLQGFGWQGEQMFAVRQKGFVVYNSAEKYKNGYGLSLRYTWRKRLGITVSWSQEQFSDIGEDNLAEARRLMLSLGYRWP